MQLPHSGWIQQQYPLPWRSRYLLSITGVVKAWRLIILLHLIDITGRSCCTAMHQRFYGELIISVIVVFVNNVDVYTVVLSVYLSVGPF